MGYTTDFDGGFKITPALKAEDAEWLKEYANTRHTEAGGDMEAPAIWCQWVPNAAGTVLVWDGGEKFYAYGEWLKHLIKKFFKPKGYTLNGDVTWSGEEPGDIGMLRMRDNVLEVKQGRVTYD